ncbi:L,D-transpeptidase [filamentous cyanobacterium LEGE 07170]|nr:L,D-transpeptidase [filamentous cyanobacterium LEGE 07170]
MTMRITIDLSDRRLTLYQGDTILHSYPIAVGREGWQTPTGEFEVQQMVQDPAWMNPFTREVIDGGHPRNPLGSYWIGFWTDGTNWVGMHGTPNPETVGTAASHGCIRLYNDDIQALFAQVRMGTPVTVVP